MNTLTPPRYVLSAMLPVLSVVLFPLLEGADVNSVWNGGARNWSVATNWTPIANYPNNGNGGLTYNARISSGGTATLTEPITVQQFTNAGGTLAGDFPFTMNELFTWNSGTISGNASIIANAGATLATTGTKTLTGRTLELGAGTTSTWIGGSIAGGSGAEIILQPGAVFDAQFDGSLTVNPAGSTTISNYGTFRKSSGTAASGTTISAVLNTQPGGLVQVTSGILNLNAGGNNSGSNSVAAGTTLSFGGGAHTFDSASGFGGAGTNRITAGTVNIGGIYAMQSGSTTISGTGTGTFSGPNPHPGNLTLSGGSATFGSADLSVLTSANISGGTLGGSGAIDVSGPFTWSGGTLSGTGLFNANGGGTIVGSGTKNLNGRRLNLNSGTTTWSVGGINSGGGAVLYNAGLFDITTDGTYNDTLGGSASITNTGTFRKSAGVGSTIIGPVFGNGLAARVEVQTGTLSFTGGGINSGTFDASAGGTFSFTGPAFQFDSTSTVSGAGTNSVSAGAVSFDGAYGVTGGTRITSSGTMTFSGPVSSVGAVSISGGTMTFDTGGTVPATALTQSGGTITGTDTIGIAGPLSWSGGTLAGAGAVNANGGGAFTGATTKTLNGRRLNLNGGTNIWSAGGINSGGGAVVNNSGLFDITLDGAFNASLGGSSTITNSSIIRKSGGLATTTLAPVLDNGPSGRVEALLGTLSFSGGGHGSGQFNVSSGATLSFAGGTHVLDGSSSVSGAGTNAISAGAVTFGGIYGVSGGTRVSAGTATFSGPISGIGALTISGGTTTFGTGAKVDVATASVSGGSVGGTDTIDLAGPFTWTGGTLAGPGAVNANGLTTLSGASRTLTGQLNIGNATTWSAGAINSGQGGVLTIRSGVLFDNTFDGSYQFAIGGTAAITNRGTFRKSGGVSPSGTVLNIAFYNAPGGALEVASGTLSLSGGGNSSGSFTTVANSTLQFGGGTHVLDGGSTVSGAGTNRITAGAVTFGGAVSVTGGITVSGGTANFSGSVAGGVPLSVTGGAVDFNGTGALTCSTMSLSGGTVGGTNDLTISSSFIWNGGTLNGSGRVIANGGAAFGTGNRNFSGRRVVIPTGKSALWTAGFFNADQGAGFDVAGLLDVAFDGQFFVGFNSAASIVNTGTIRKSAGTGAASFAVALNNNGVVNVDSGQLNLSGGGNSNGRFSVAATTTMDFVSGNFSLTAGSLIDGAGTVGFEGATVDLSGGYDVAGTTLFDGGTVNFKPGAVIKNLGGPPTIAGTSVNLDTGSTLGLATLTISGGALGGSDLVNVTNQFVWSNGTLSGTNVLNALGGATMNGFGRSLSGRRLNLFGSSTWSGGQIDINNGAVLYIEPGATLLTTFDGSIGGFGGTGGITNAGTFRKNGGTSATTFYSMLNNQGLVEINTGSLTLQFGTYTQTSGTTLLNGGDLILGPEFDLLGGTLIGHGMVSGSVTNNSIISPGSPIGTLNFTGDLAQGPGGVFVFELGGTQAGTDYDQINVNLGTVSLGGTLSVVLTNGFLPAIDDSFRVMTFVNRTNDFVSFTGFDLGVIDRHLEPVYDTGGLTLVTRAGPLSAAGPTISLLFHPPGTLELTWPNQFTGFHLESATNITTPVWLPFGSTTTNQIFVPVDLSDFQRYFRLKNP